MESLLYISLDVCGIIFLISSIPLRKELESKPVSKRVFILLPFFFASMFFSLAAFLCIDKLNVFLMIVNSVIAAYNFKIIKNNIYEDINDAMFAAISGASKYIKYS